MDRKNNILLYQNIFQEGEYKDLSFLSDLQLLTEDGWSFEVHRYILAKENIYFRSLISSHDNEGNVIKVPNITGRTLNKVLYYIYTKTLSLNDEDICELLEASDYLFNDSLKLEIKKYCMTNISIQNCFPMYLTSLKVNFEDLLKFSYRFLQTHFQTMLKNGQVDFDEIPLESIKEILQDNKLYVTGEHVVWSCIVRWIEINPESRLSALPDLLKCLKIADVDESLANEVIHSDIIIKNPFYADLIVTEDRNHFHCCLDVLKYLIENSTTLSDHYDYHIHRHPKCLHIMLQHQTWLHAHKPYQEQFMLRLN